jgi:hypothetical protein
MRIATQISSSPRPSKSIVNGVDKNSISSAAAKNDLTNSASSPWSTTIRERSHHTPASTCRFSLQGSEPARLWSTHG